MSGELEMTYASTVTLEGNGAALADGAYAQADDAMLSSANHENYPLADVVLYVPGFASALSGYKEIYLYRRDMNLAGGSNDEPAPSSTYKGRRVGEFKLPEDNAAGTSGYYQITDVPLSQNCYFYISNETGQELNNGWILYATPKTYVPGS